METFNAKGKLTGTNQQKVLSYVSTANSFKAKIYSALLSEKGKELMKGDLDFTCTDGTLLIDMRNFVNQEQMKAFDLRHSKPRYPTVGQGFADFFEFEGFDDGGDLFHVFNLVNTEFGGRENFRTQRTQKLRKGRKKEDTKIQPKIGKKLTPFIILFFRFSFSSFYLLLRPLRNFCVLCVRKSAFIFGR